MSKFNVVWILLMLVSILSACGQNAAVLPQINSFEATPASLNKAGSVKLSWEVTGASSLSIEPGIGTVTGTSKTVDIASSTTFTLTAKNNNGSVNVQTKVTVNLAPFSYQIDPSVTPPIPSLEGNRLVTAVQDDAGVVSAFVLDEIVIYPKTQAELNEFLIRCGGTVVSTNAVPEPPPGLGITLEPKYKTPTEYLVKVDVSSFDLKNFATDASQIGLSGTFKFSSDEGVKLIALIASEKARGFDVSANYVSVPNEVLLSTRERSTGGGSFDDAFDPVLFPQYQNTGSRASVVQAWQWLQAHGIQRRARVAIIDGGFWLDANGNPLTAPGDGSDLPQNPIQYDFVQNDYIAGAMNPNNCSGGNPCPWHGNASAGVATGIVNNQAASAGTGGLVSDPMLFHVSADRANQRWAIRTAIAWQADVINMSYGGPCGRDCRIDERDHNVYREAANAGIVLVASAGNSGIDTGDDNFVHPCINDGVICVGALADGGNTRYDTTSSGGWASNFGRVDIWAPTNIRRMSDGAGGIGNFGGTSASSPFIAGIAAMMKAINPTLNGEDVRTILRDTGWTDSSDSNVSRYVNALEAVKRASNYVLPPDRFETNNSAASATRLSAGQYDDLNLHISNDVDFYRIDTAGATLATIDLTYPSGLGKASLPPFGHEASRSCGNFEQLEYSTQPNKAHVVYRLPAGNFFFAVNGFPKPLPYDIGLKLSGETINPDAYEPNDTLAQKHYLGDGGYVDATLHTNSDVDFFQFYSPGNFKTMVLSMSSGVSVQNSDNPLTLDIYDDRGTFFQRVSTTDDCRTQAALNLPQGYWTIRVSGRAPGTYRLWMGSHAEQHPLIDVSVLIYLILHPNVPVEFVVRDKEAWFIVENRSDFALKEINLYSTVLHLALYNEEGKLILDGKPGDFHGMEGEVLSLSEGLSEKQYLVRLTRATEALENSQRREFPIIRGSLEMVIPRTESR